MCPDLKINVIDLAHIFSSPEHKVLRMSYLQCCVGRPLCGANYLPCVRSRGHIFRPIIIKLGQNVCNDEFSYVLENG